MILPDAALVYWAPELRRGEHELVRTPQQHFVPRDLFVITADDELRLTNIIIGQSCQLPRDASHAIGLFEGWLLAADFDRVLRHLTNVGRTQWGWTKEMPLLDGGAKLELDGAGVLAGQVLSLRLVAPRDASNFLAVVTGNVVGGPLVGAGPWKPVGGDQ